MIEKELHWLAAPFLLVKNTVIRFYTLFPELIDYGFGRQDAAAVKSVESVRLGNVDGIPLVVGEVVGFALLNV